VCTCRTGRNQGDIRALEAKLDRQVARDHVDDRTRDEEWRNFAYTASGIFVLGPFDQRQTTDTGTDGNANAFEIDDVFFIQTRITHSLNASSQAKMDEVIHAACVFGGNILSNVKVPDLAGNLDREGAGIELGDCGNTGFACQNILPSFFNGVSDRANDAQTGNYDSATCQGALRKQM